ncbi:MAG: sulfurtransferase [Arcobacter sp.]|nr:sulfurtransferase [Arcobacter sp.]|tara:strand:+ start:5007 stop:5681 length:675 start_codon:yes stop_codon:yes gene_type:complete
MKKIILSSLLTSLLLSAADLQSTGIEVAYTDSNDEDKTIVIKRETPENCKTVKFSPKNILGGNLVDAKVPENCKTTVITYLGKISPIKFSPKIETYGEVEVLEFMDKASDNENMLLVDSRTVDWYLNQTIPSAINIPFIHLNKGQYPDDFLDALDTIGVEVTENGYDFTNAKELLLFCNGVWCGQSPLSMKNLISIGYPEEKLKWYRGGIQSWLSLGLPSIKPN